MQKRNVTITFWCQKEELARIVSHSDRMPSGEVRIKQGTDIAKILTEIQGKVRFGIVAVPLSAHDTISAYLGYERDQPDLYEILFSADQTTPILVNLPGLNEDNPWFYASKEFKIEFHTQAELYEGD